MDGKKSVGPQETIEDFSAIITKLLIEIVHDLGIRSLSFDEIMADEIIRNMDLARLGLGSLDWIKLALLVNNETGLELPERVLVNADCRTVADWAEALASVSGSRSGSAT